MAITGILRPFARFRANLDRATRVLTTRRDLELLDDRMLKDLGISRAQAEFEASRSVVMNGRM